MDTSTPDSFEHARMFKVYMFETHNETYNNLSYIEKYLFGRLYALSYDESGHRTSDGVVYDDLDARLELCLSEEEEDRAIKSLVDRHFIEVGFVERSGLRTIRVLESFKTMIDD